MELTPLSIVLFALAALLAVVLLGLAIGAILNALSSAVTDGLRKSRPYRAATAALLADESAISLLGAPVEFGDPMGSINSGLFGSTTRMEVPATGPRANGVLSIREHRLLLSRSKRYVLEVGASRTVEISPGRGAQHAAVSRN